MLEALDVKLYHRRVQVEIVEPSYGARNRLNVEPSRVVTIDPLFQPAPRGGLVERPQAVEDVPIVGRDVKDEFARGVAQPDGTNHNVLLSAVAAPQSTGEER